MAVVMVAFLAGFLMLVVYAGRVGQARNDVRSAAHEAARAASEAAAATACCAIAHRPPKRTMSTNRTRTGARITTSTLTEPVSDPAPVRTR